MEIKCEKTKGIKKLIENSKRLPKISPPYCSMCLHFCSITTLLYFSYIVCLYSICIYIYISLFHFLTSMENIIICKTCQFLIEMSQMKDWWYLICDCLFDIAIPYKYISILNGMYCVPVICKLMFLIKYNWHLANNAHTTFIDVLWLMGERARENNNNNKRMGTFVYDNKPLKINGIENLIIYWI